MTSEQLVRALRDLGDRIEKRLETLERKLELAAIEPRAVSRPVAARLLGVKLTKLKGMEARGVVRTKPYEPGGHPMVPMSEIVRLTSMTSSPSRAPEPRRGGRLPGQTKSKTEMVANVRAELKKRNRKR